MSLTGIRDLDLKILNELDDVDLVNICQTNKQADEYCKDQGFWLNRILSKFPGVDMDILTKYKDSIGNISWSDYYIHDLRGVGSRFGKNIDHELIEAARNGRLDHAAILLDKGAHNTFTAPIAAANGHLDVLKYLVEKEGFDIHVESEAALRFASQNGYLDIVKYLMEKGADIHALWDFSLRHASENGHLNVVKYLVENGADIHAENDTYIVDVFHKGRRDVVDYLVSQGAPDPR